MRTYVRFRHSTAPPYHTAKYAMQNSVRGERLLSVKDHFVGEISGAPPIRTAATYVIHFSYVESSILI